MTTLGRFSTEPGTPVRRFSYAVCAAYLSAATRRWTVGGATLLAVLLGTMLAAARAADYHSVRSIKLPQVTGWDYLAVDPDDRRLYVSSNSGILVFNVDTLRKVGTVPSSLDWQGVGLVHGVAVADRLGLGFVSREIPSSIVTFRLSDLAVMRSTPTDGGTDAIVYDPVTRRVFTCNGKYPGVHDMTAMDAASGKSLGNVPLPGVPEFPVADGRGHVFVNVESLSKLAQIDSRTLKVTRVSSMGPCRHPSGLAIDHVHRRLFAACENQIMVMISADTGSVVGSVRTGEGTDAAGFDAGTGDVFASNGAGTLTVAREVTPNSLVLLQQVKTIPSARTMALDPRTHQVFLVSATFGAVPAHPSAENPHGYPVAIPGSAHLLVYAP